MIDRLKEYLEQVEAFSSTDPQEIETFRVSYAGKKGILNDLFASFREVPVEEKKAFGQELNKLKEAVTSKVKELQTQSRVGASKMRISDPSRTAQLEPVAVEWRSPVLLPDSSSALKTCIATPVFKPGGIFTSQPQDHSKF